MSMEFNWHKEVEKRWDGNVQFWSDKSKDMWENGSRSSIVPFFEKHVEAGSRVADVGCGDGYGSYKLNQAGFSVIGVDISPKMVEYANQQAQEGLQFQVGDLSSLPFEDHSFDGLIAINSMEWTETPLLALQEMRRVLKPGGHLCVGLLGPTAGPRQNSYNRLYGESVICNTMMPWELEQLAAENGFRIKDGEPVYKEGVTTAHTEALARPLQQALTFMWLSMLVKQ
ncbi:class I SAM-dependent methyltransferase [Pontibacillus salicampi]|uniref:Class I SAM-dependent methyltransferase n=1 Tax=Pontibacillus salicampi TaxID=1449801 RepID=A0ABV6LJB8_9BACI